MHEGEKMVCPHCGETTFLKKHVILDGWKTAGAEFVCAFCGKHIADFKEETSAPNPEKDSAEKLRSLLGTEDVKTELPDFMKEKADFCKDCASLVVHPFHLRCALTGKNVEPMDDCPRFTKRS